MPARDDDPLQDAEFVGLVRALSMQKRMTAIRSLRAGNDVGCFTTDQYIAAWAQTAWQHTRDVISVESAEMHLRSCSAQVQEVKPGLWAFKELTP